MSGSHSEGAAIGAKMTRRIKQENKQLEFSMLVLSFRGLPLAASNLVGARRQPRASSR